MYFTTVCCVQANRRGVTTMNTTLENEESRKWMDMVEHSQKVTIIDAQVRLMREVDGSIEHVTWFVDVDVLLAFIQQHYLEQAR